MVAEALLCMILNVYNEARSEPFLGQVAVAETVLNRMDDPRWPDDACSVIYQPYQYSWTLIEDLEPPRDLIAYHRAKQTVEYAIDHRSMSATHYHHIDITPTWSKHPRMDYLFTIEHHKFYFEDTR